MGAGAMLEEKIRAMAHIIRHGGGMALTGAGISAESGMSTYRGPGGLWERYPEGKRMGILGMLLYYPQDAPQVLGDFFDRLEHAEPNAAHRALAELERMSLLRGVITQNTDDLHQQAGNRCVYALHGNIYRLRCLTCGSTRVLGRTAFVGLGHALVRAAAISLEAVVDVLPLCTCTGRMRPDVVGFGEPVQDIKEALTEVYSCAWMLVVGTSGIVRPAAALPSKAKERGAKIIEVNPLPSPISDLADIVVRAPAGEILPSVVRSVKQLSNQDLSQPTNLLGQ
jgi:NAD-dependent deacetylase